MSDDEWPVVLPSLTLMAADASQRHHDLREAFNGYIGEQPTADAAAHQDGPRAERTPTSTSFVAESYQRLLRRGR